MPVLYMIVVKITMNTGDVNWRTIAFAAVVILFEQTKQVYTIADSMPVIRVFLFRINLYFFSAM